LTYLAGQTRQIRLAVAGLTLPRPDPVRLAEQIILLDNLSAGRLLLGVDLTRSAVEPARALLDSLDSGEVEADALSETPGRHELRPRLERALQGRIHAIPGPSTAMSELAALGAAPVVTVGRSGAPEHDLAAFRDAWREVADSEPPGPICRASILLEDDTERLEELASAQLVSAQLTAAQLPSDPQGRDGDGAGGRPSLVPWGSPDQVLARLGDLREQTGMTAFIAALCFGGMPYEEAERNIACFVDQMLPALQAWDAEPVPPARR
jgi:alkanesulfonate monooxygenase SsuD/methylene tetrahydromethanopterin reductase-like flavin-dependent oxidoreductase (luciferase family)